MIKWFIRRSPIDENAEEMLRVRAGRRMDVVVAKDFLNTWNLDDSQDEPVMQKMYINGEGFVEKDDYMKALEHGMVEYD